jgi:hypothetical protein
MKMAVLKYVAPCTIVEIDRNFKTLMLEAVSTSEMSVNFCEAAQHNIPKTVIIRQYHSLWFLIVILLGSASAAGQH